MLNRMKKYLRIFIFQTAGFFILFFLIMCTFYVLGLYSPRLKWLMGGYSEPSQISQWVHFNLIVSIWIGFVVGLTETISKVIREKKEGNRK